MNPDFQFRLWELVAWSVGIKIDLRQGIERPRFNDALIQSDKQVDFFSRLAAAASAINYGELAYIRAIIDRPQSANFVVNAGNFIQWARRKALTLPTDAPIAGPGRPPAEWKSHAKSIINEWLGHPSAKRTQDQAAAFIKARLEALGIGCPEEDTIKRDFVRKHWSWIKEQLSGGN